MSAALKNGKICGPAGIYTPAVFQTLLKHERCRADRDNSEFSLAVLDVVGVAGNNRVIRQIIECIREKMRSIDEVGWLDEKRIGVLLPLAGSSGGEKFVLRIIGSFTTRLPLIPWSVYSYPTHWAPGAEMRAKSSSGSPTIAESAPSTRIDSNILDNLFGEIFCRKIPQWKRYLDIAGSLFFIALLSPLFLAVAAFILCVSPGKIFYKQARVGYKGKSFVLLKFRTMHEKNDSSAHRDYVKQLIRGQIPMKKLDGGSDPRIIPGGKILRKACIDELPQLFNVLFGSMSLVGPRPCIPYEAEEFMRWHRHRFDILPGMTGLWQVSGKNKLSFEKMIRLDISYADHMSFFKDIKILIKTIPTIIGLFFEKAWKKIGKKVKKGIPNFSDELITAGIESESVHNA
jgi:lipopolysaccharide/colanic/teichoic acid biosynthesis glycosyltransferase